MCGRYTAAFSRSELADYFRLPSQHIEFSARYNIAPTQKVPVVSHNNGERLWSVEATGEVNVRQVSKLVNSPLNDDMRCIQGDKG